MIRFALVVASVLGFVLTAALGNMMVPLLRELQRAARGTQPDSDAPDSPVPTMGGLCLMVGTLAAVGVGWLAACAAQPSLLGSDRQMTSRLLIALLGSLAFGAVGLADDLARIRGRYPNGLGLGPPIQTAPSCASQNRGIKAAAVVFPLPDAPTRATVFPSGIWNDRCVSAGVLPPG